MEKRLRRKRIMSFVLLLFIIIIKKLNMKTKHKRWINRRWHVRPINRNRQQQGEYNNLFQELVMSKDYDMFFEYTRMSMRHFNKLLRLVQPHLTKRSHLALTAAHRLVIVIK